MSYTEIRNLTAAQTDAIFACARGCYQRNLLLGVEAWSGATLQGTASSYGYHYARSRDNLMTRLYGTAKRIGLVVREERRAHGKRVVVIYAQPVVGDETSLAVECAVHAIAEAAA